jgi:hypothetical protein
MATAKPAASRPAGIAAFALRQQDREHDQDRDAADVDKDLDDGQELGALEQEEPGHAEETEHESEGRAKEARRPHRDHRPGQGDYRQRAEDQFSGHGSCSGAG